MRNLNFKYSIYIVVYTFFFLYSPPFLPIYSLHILAVCSCFLLFFYKNNYLKQIIVNTRILNYLGPLALAMIYLFCVVSFNDTKLKELNPYIALTIEVPICIIYLCSYFKKNRYTIHDILNVVLIAGTIQAIIAMFCFFVPAFKNVIIEILAGRSIFGDIGSNEIEKLAGHRLNGFSSSLTYAMPIIQSLLGMIALYLSFNKNYTYIFFVPLLLFSAVINARTSFVVMLYGIILLVIMSIKGRKALLKFMLTVLAMILIIPFIMQFMSDSFGLISDWISDGFIEIVSFLQGENTGYFEIIFTYFIRFPEGASLLFGTGSTIFGIGFGGSDIGYVNDVWLGGLFFISIIYPTIMSYYIRIYKINDELVKFISALFFGTFLIGNIKGRIVSTNEFMYLSVLLSAIFILYKNENFFKKDKLKSEKTT